jgi:CHAT domain-containing protein
MDDPKLIPCPECGGTGKVPLRLDNLPTPLSAPDVAAVPGDGLLTMEEILGLKLNADWVVPSACDTGAAAGAGAGAASGLGRAFFYAGTRAILVTNWSVHSESARELVTDLFRRQGTRECPWSSWRAVRRFAGLRGMAVPIGVARLFQSAAVPYPNDWMMRVASGPLRKARKANAASAWSPVFRSTASRLIGVYSFSGTDHRDPPVRPTICARATNPSSPLPVHQSRGPSGTDATDEHQLCIGRRRQVDRPLRRANFVLTDHAGGRARTF